MVETPSSSSSSSSCASFSSFDDVSVKSGGVSAAVKFLCSYGGKILPRYPDGKLRYFGGETRVLAVDRSVSYSELHTKMGEVCGWNTVSVRCQLPTEDLDALVSITSDEDLANLIEEYDLASRDRLVPLKIRAFFHETTSSKRPKSPTSPPPIPPSAAVQSQRRCLHHHHHQQQICSDSSRVSGRFGSDPRVCGTHQHQHQHQHHHHHGISRNYHYLVHQGNSSRH